MQVDITAKEQQVTHFMNNKYKKNETLRKLKKLCSFIYFNIKIFNICSRLLKKLIKKNPQFVKLDKKKILLEYLLGTTNFVP